MRPVTLGLRGDKRHSNFGIVDQPRVKMTFPAVRNSVRAMGRENAETVRRACEAWGTGDISIYREMYAPDVTAYAGQFAPELPGGEFTGLEQIMAAFESLMATFAHSELILGEIIGEGDTLVAPVVMRAVTEESQATIEWHLAIAYRFRDGLIVHQAWYPTLEEALEKTALDSAPSRFER